MGSSSWSSDSFQSLKATNSTKSTAQIFTNKSTAKDMSPKGVQFRESRDSDAHPYSIAVAVNLDVTGSMGKIPAILVKEKLGALMDTLIAHGVADAHVMFSAIGDHYTDTSPLQVGQFEAGTTELNKWLTSIYLEGNGGGQRKESYSLAWLFAARHTSIDCFEKRGEKGFLFTIGDEWVHPTLEADALKDLLGYSSSENIDSKQLLKEAQRMYNVFHLHITETGEHEDGEICKKWKDLLGERLIVVKDYETVAEIIATTVAVCRGADINKVVSGFDSKTANTVTNALVKIGSSIVPSKKEEGVMVL